MPAVLDTVVVKAPDRCNDRMHRVFKGFIGLQRDQECLLVLRATLRIAAITLAAP
jgi:hypothetical protein